MEDLALSLASTIRHDGDGGVADDLVDVSGLRAWAAGNAALLSDNTVAITSPDELDELALRQIRELRRAVRSLFARAVRPDPPSRPDANRLMPLDDALDLVNTAAGRQPLVPRIECGEAGTPVARFDAAPLPAAGQLAAGAARATIALLTGPHAKDLRSCQAPRCVRYFIKDHPRQQWCKPSCGTRARVARHYRRHHLPAQQ